MAETQKKKVKPKFDLRTLRLSLKYRPKILKLLLKMRQCIRKKNTAIAKLKQQLKDTTNNPKDNSTPQINVATSSLKDTESNTGKTPEAEAQNKIETSDSINKEFEGAKKKIKTKNKSTQTDNVTSTNNNSLDLKKVEEKLEDSGWKVNEENETKSIAEQVKEAAQDAMKQSGMVYVESAGMYYDYKTGYYYNSELGLYYHPDTECYYYYSEEKHTYVFHSYPDRSAAAAQASLVAHMKKKAKKHKMDAEDGKLVKKPKLKKSKRKAEEKDSSKEKKEDNNSQKNTEEIKVVTSEVKKDEDIFAVDKEATSEMKEDGEIDELTEEVKKEIEPSENKEDEKNETAIPEVNKPEELEDGECSDTDSEESGADDEVVKSNASTHSASDDESIARHFPPCMRVIVRETSLPKLRVGSLFIVTKDGGTVGREGEHHTVLLPDTNVSRNHMDIRYNSSRQTYMATDLGSKNGSILNGTRMSESQVISHPMEIVHGSTLQLGETKLLCHIHPGNDTCGHCEPGLLIEATDKEKKVAYTRTCSVKKQYELELARLKNVYGVKPMLAIEQTPYNDRAQARREAVGSSHHSEKTQASDIDTPVAPDNKGFKLLEKMGWNKGEGLGKDCQGNVEPVPLVSNEGKTGLGAIATPMAPGNRLSKATMILASRSKLLKPPAKAFQGVFDEDSD